MAKKVLASVFLSLFLLCAVFLFNSVLQPGTLEVGAPLPPVVYRTANGSESLRANGLNQYLVMYFSSKCQYCEYILETLNSNLEDLDGTRIVLLTPEANFLDLHTGSRWPSLEESPFVTFGIVDKRAWSEGFGRGIFPSIFIFDATGRLKASIFGECKLARLLTELK